MQASKKLKSGEIKGCGADFGVCGGLVVFVKRGCVLIAYVGLRIFILIVKAMVCV